MTEYTDAQNIAIAAAKEILGEHFHAFSIITMIEGSEDEESSATEGCFHHYQGGFWAVLGMIDDTHAKMRARSGDNSGDATYGD